MPLASRERRRSDHRDEPAGRSITRRARGLSDEKGT